MKKILKDDIEVSKWYLLYHGNHSGRFKHYFKFKLTKQSDVFTSITVIAGRCNGVYSGEITGFVLEKNHCQLLQNSNIYELDELETIHHLIAENI